MPHSGVQIKLDRSGGVTVFCGSTDIGQGSDSILVYAIAEEFGIDPADIRVVTADTDLTPVDLGSYSSRVTIMTGNAAIQACGRLKPLLVEAASEALEVPVDDLEFAEGQVRSARLPQRGIGFAECVRKAEGKHGTLGATGVMSLLEVDKQGRRRLYALPDTIRRQVARRSVLDLGCCSFKFDQAPAAIKLRPRRRPSPGRPRRLAR